MWQFSDEDCAKDRWRSPLAIVMSRTSHASSHSGQAVFAQ
jgi:hypothetical protein